MLSKLQEKKRKTTGSWWHVAEGQQGICSLSLFCLFGFSLTVSFSAVTDEGMPQPQSCPKLASTCSMHSTLCKNWQKCIKVETVASVLWSLFS